MPTVRLRFSPSPAHVRTARLVAAACGRRAGVAVGRLDELKLAVGEACGRAMARHQRAGLAELILLELTDDEGFEARVFDYAPAEPSSTELGDSEETVVAEAGIALLAESADVLKVISGPDGIGSQVSLWWPTEG
ncbi:MAG: ATP-binding protein [Longispora sp.]|nr:ATP-binding protein [Longispora sp. (in: high G+C Gram-positive bacteria)]